MMRIRSCRSVCATINSRPRWETPIVIYRSSSPECSSSITDINAVAHRQRRTWASHLRAQSVVLEKVTSLATDTAVVGVRVFSARAFCFIHIHQNCHFGIALRRVDSSLICANLFLSDSSFSFSAISWTSLDSLRRAISPCTRANSSLSDSSFSLSAVS